MTVSEIKSMKTMKKKFNVYVIVITILSLTACSKNITASWQEQYDLGMQYLTDGDYRAANIKFTSAIEIEPKSASLYVSRGDAYYEWANEVVSEAIATVSDGEFLKWEDVVTDGNIYSLQELYENAQNDYETAINLLEDGEATDQSDDVLDKAKKKLDESKASEQESKQELANELVELAGNILEGDPTEEDKESANEILEEARILTEDEDILDTIDELQEIIDGKNIASLDESIEEVSESLSRKNYYDSTGKLLYYEIYAYYDDGLLCSTTLYEVEYYTDWSYYSEQYTILYLYDEEGNASEINLDAFKEDLFGGFDAATGRVSLGYGSSTNIYPKEESIEQEKFGVDPSKTEEIYGDAFVFVTDTTIEWKYAYFIDVFNDGEPSDATFYRFIYINDDYIPEIWMEGGYSYISDCVFTCAASFNPDSNGEVDLTGMEWTSSISVPDGEIEWIDKGNLLHVSGGRGAEYYDAVYQIQDGNFVSIGEGSYGVYDEGNITYDEQDNIICDYYYWNGTEVSENEYKYNLNSLFDATYKADSKKNIYTYDQCELLISYLLLKCK